MKPVAATIVALLLQVLPAPCSLRVFRDTEGRKVAAELLDAGPGWAQVKRVDGQRFTIQLDRLSADDKAWVEDWRQKRDAAEARQKREEANRAKLVAFCKAHHGQPVGDGICWTLADEAFKACGLRRPGREPRVWGRLIDLTKEKPLPGDIVEFRSARFPDAMTGPEHTAVVVASAPKGRIVIAEQNWSNVRKVHTREMDPSALISGELMFYRPE